MLLNTELKAKYGTTEYNSLHSVLGEDDVDAYRSAEITVDWTDPDLKRIVRLRLLADSGVADVSYCWGVLKDGTKVHVDLPFDQLRSRNIKGQILKYAARDKVYAKGLGVFDADVLSILY
jgi:hypothetical protein